MTAYPDWCTSRSMSTYPNICSLSTTELPELAIQSSSKVCVIGNNNIRNCLSMTNCSNGKNSYNQGPPTSREVILLEQLGNANKEEVKLELEWNREPETLRLAPAPKVCNKVCSNLACESCDKLACNIATSLACKECGKFARELITRRCEVLSIRACLLLQCLCQITACYVVTILLQPA